MKLSTEIDSRLTTKVQLLDEGTDALTIGHLRRFVDQSDRSTLADKTKVSILVTTAEQSILGYVPARVSISASEVQTEATTVPWEESK